MHAVRLRYTAGGSYQTNAAVRKCPERRGEEGVESNSSDTRYKWKTNDMNYVA